MTGYAAVFPSRPVYLEGRNAFIWLTSQPMLDLLLSSYKGSTIGPCTSSGLAACSDRLLSECHHKTEHRKATRQNSSIKTIWHLVGERQWHKYGRSEGQPRR